MKSATELRIQRAATKAFIDADAVTLVLHTREKILTGANQGMLIDGPDRPPQVFRLIPQQPSPFSGSRLNVEEQSTQSFQYVLLGETDSEMELYDWWFLDTGQQVEITTMMPDNGYERKGLVTVYNRAK